VSGDDPGLPARRDPLAPRTQGIDGIASPARDLAVSMKGKQACRSLDGPREMCRRCRCLSWKKWIGTFEPRPA
jgi:hypothetical protein